MLVIEQIKEWARARELHLAPSEKQFLKVTEEVGEIAAGLARQDKEQIMDGIGDTVVTLVVLCETLDLNFKQCVEGVYDVIQNRKGKTVDGVFIKEE